MTRARYAAVREQHICGVIPCFNVGALCMPVVREAALHCDEVIVVDDGSTDGTREALEVLASELTNVHVLVHPSNRGKGASLLGAFRYALMKFEFDALVTLDGDAQHRPQDIPRLADALRRSRAALCMGERVGFDPMPLRSRIGNAITSALVKLMYADAPADTQSGFRALSRDFANQVVQHLRGGRYETELRILLMAMERGSSVTSVPIPTLYHAGNRSSHFNPLVDSVRVLAALVSWGWKTRGRTREYADTSSRTE